MESTETHERFERRLWLRPLSNAVGINDDGLVFGAGTVLARMARDPSGLQVLALDDDRSRLFVLLAAAYGRSPPSDLIAHLESAVRLWKRGDRALANIRLAFARMRRLEGRDAAYRLFLAESLLDGGLPPDALTKVMGLEPASSGLAKYNPDQPRVPAGNGQNSGQWTSGDKASDQALPIASPSADAGIALPAASAAGTLADGLFGAVEAGEFLAGLGAFAATIGVGAALGAVFVWPGKSVISEGLIPGDSNLRYSLNSDEGVLRFLRHDDFGSETVAVAHVGREGIFFELETGTPVARTVGDSLAFDASSLADVADKAPARIGTQTEFAVATRKRQSATLS